MARRNAKKRSSGKGLLCLFAAILLVGALGLNGSKQDKPESTKGLTVITSKSTPETTLPSISELPKEAAQPPTEAATEAAAQPPTEAATETVTEPPTQAATEPPTKATTPPTTAPTAAPSVKVNERTYVLNTNTHKFHYEYCSSANQIKEKNRREYEGTRDEIIAMGYDPCGKCHP